MGQHDQIKLGHNQTKMGQSNESKPRLDSFVKPKWEREPNHNTKAKANQDETIEHNE
jgi:hypothetical protein